jgi:glutamate racemase
MPLGDSKVKIGFWTLYQFVITNLCIMKQAGPIGVFDSGYGGLTVLKAIRERLPEYDYLYLGDSARTPYGTRSYESVYEFTLQGVQYLFERGCHLVILACNTASAKALRTIQQKDLPRIDPDRRVLGVIRPTAEMIGEVSRSGVIGLFGTQGTVQSASYLIEIEKFAPEAKVIQEACPMWVPLVENGELQGEGADYFVRQHVDRLYQSNDEIDTILLACTHYPLLQQTIEKFVNGRARIISQGPIVAESLADYLNRHPEIKRKCTTGGASHFLTTDSVTKFEELGSLFYGANLQAEQIHIS